MLLKDIFGAKPNSKNLKEFFQIEVIWKLWSGDGGFMNSQTYKRILNEEFSKDQKHSFLKYFDRVYPPENYFEIQAAN